MKEEQIKRNLQSVGMACFVKYFRLFSDKTITDAVAVETLRSQEGYTESGSRTRVSVSRRLIAQGYARAALYMVTNAEKVDVTTRRTAQTLLNKLPQA